MSDQDQAYDIVIVGGGITGAGVARDASLRGFKVALFEMNDFGSGTSSKSSKLIHGGLRYLKTGEIGLVHESVSERHVQRKVAPHLVRPLPFIIPVYKGNKPGLFLMNIGLWMYDTLALFRSPRLHKTYRKAQRLLALESKLKKEGLKGGIEYYDCTTDDARLVLENILDAQANGADCFSYHKVTSVTKPEGQPYHDITITDRIGGDTKTVRAKCVVAALGAWTDQSNGELELTKRDKYLRATKGAHLVFPQELLPLERTVTVISPVDGRVMFAIPWRDRTVIGTTDTDYSGDVEDCVTSYEDADYLCRSANEYFPEANLKPEQAISSWAGLRPLLRDEDAKHESAVSREHDIFTYENGVVLIAGGKLTTYRLMADQCVKAAQRWLWKHDPELYQDALPKKCETGKRPLPGAVGLDLDDEQLTVIVKDLVTSYSLSQSSAWHLASTYGARVELMKKIFDSDERWLETVEDGLPFVWGEIVFACRHDLALTLNDVLVRRVPLVLCGTEQGTQVAQEVADIAAGELGWDEKRTEREVADYMREAKLAIQFKATSAGSQSEPKSDESPPPPEQTAANG